MSCKPAVPLAVIHEADPAVEVAWVAPRIKEGERIIVPGVIKRSGKLTANVGSAITFEYMANESVSAWYRMRCDFLQPDGKGTWPTRAS